MIILDLNWHICCMQRCLFNLLQLRPAICCFLIRDFLYRYEIIVSACMDSSRCVCVQSVTTITLIVILCMWGFFSPHLLIPPVSQCECFIHPNQASKGLKENAYVAEKRIRMTKYRKKQHKMRSKGAGPP